MLKRMHKGQTILEYTLIVVIILGVIIAMQVYVKRGIQGRWKSAADDFGGQYDPRNVNALIKYSTQSNSQSMVHAVNGTLGTGVAGQWTNRMDTSNSIETKTGFTQVGK